MKVLFDITIKNKVYRFCEGPWDQKLGLQNRIHTVVILLLLLYYYHRSCGRN